MVTTVSSRTSLDGYGIFAIIVFAVIALICIQPVHIPVPHAVSTRARAVRRRLIGGEEDQVTRISADSNGSTSIQPPAATGLGVDAARKRSYIVLNHVWTPAIGILLLLATTTIGGEQIKLGIIGEEGVEPYDVLVFFISLAYIAISLDATGLLRYLAFQVCLKAGNSGMGLYLILYAFFWTLGVLVGNDPVILSGTAFLVYLTRTAGISPPSAWIWGQFVAANISSAVLVSSNPTNLVIASGFNISFPVYTAYMVLPALASAASALVAILLFFRNKTFDQAPTKAKAGKASSTANGRNGMAIKRRESSARKRSKGPGETEDGIAMATVGDTPSRSMTNGDGSITPTEETERKTPIIYIPKTIVRPDVNPREALVDPKGAIFVSVVMAATLATVIITNVTGGAKVYMIAAPGAAVALCRDVVYDWYTWRSFRKKEQAGSNDVEPETNSQQAEESVKKPPPTSEARPLLAPLIRVNKTMQDRFPTVTYVMARLPFPLLPFAFGMFILVQSLQHVGFINIMAGGLGDVCAHGYVGCSFFISTLGVILCNLGGTNIGATILLTRALQSTYFQDRLPASDTELILRAASYSVAFGSNVGALGGTFAASLAGLLWRDGLLQRGVLVTKAQFVLWCAVVIVPATVSGVAVLLPEVRYFNLK